MCAGGVRAAAQPRAGTPKMPWASGPVEVEPRGALDQPPGAVPHQIPMSWQRGRAEVERLIANGELEQVTPSAGVANRLMGDADAHIRLGRTSGAGGIRSPAGTPGSPTQPLSPRTLNLKRVKRAAGPRCLDAHIM